MPGIEFEPASWLPTLDKHDHQQQSMFRNGGVDEEKGQIDEPKEGVCDQVLINKSFHEHPVNKKHRSNDESGVHRRRGRPPGSKNKPKHPIIITRDSHDTLLSHIMEVTDGVDLVGSIAQYARKRQHGVCVLSGKGVVTNVTLRLSAEPNSVVFLQGGFEILSLTGTFLPDHNYRLSNLQSGLTIYLAGVQGQVVGGTVIGSLIAVGPVVVTAATFAKPNFERLPLDQDDADTGGGAGSHRQSSDAARNSPPGIGTSAGQECTMMPNPSSSLHLYSLVAPSLLLN